MKNICTIMHNDENKRVTISTKKQNGIYFLFVDGEQIETPELKTLKDVTEYCRISWDTFFWKREWC